MGPGVVLVLVIGFWLGRSLQIPRFLLWGALLGVLVYLLESAVAIVLLSSLGIYADLPESSGIFETITAFVTEVWIYRSPIMLGFLGLSISAYVGAGIGAIWFGRRRSLRREVTSSE